MDLRLKLKGVSPERVILAWGELIEEEGRDINYSFAFVYNGLIASSFCSLAGAAADIELMVKKMPDVDKVVSWVGEAYVEKEGV
jgi:hypothetical protein